MEVKVRTERCDKPNAQMPHIPASPCQQAEVLTQPGYHPSSVFRVTWAATQTDRQKHEEIISTFINKDKVFISLLFGAVPTCLTASNYAYPTPPPKGNKGKYQITRAQEDLGASCYCAPLRSCCFRFLPEPENMATPKKKKRKSLLPFIFFSFRIQASLSSHELRHLRLEKEVFPKCQNALVL